MINLTEKENALLNVMREEGEACTGANSADDMKNDNMSYTLISDIKSAMKINDQQVGGIVTSLLEKGLIWNEDGAENNEPMWSLSDKGIDASYDLI